METGWSKFTNPLEVLSEDAMVNFGLICCRSLVALVRRFLITVGSQLAVGVLSEFAHRIVHCLCPFILENNEENIRLCFLFWPAPRDKRMDQGQDNKHLKWGHYFCDLNGHRELCATFFIVVVCILCFFCDDSKDWG